MQFPLITDTYQFKCTMCGNCCVGEQTVLLDLLDIYKMACYLNFTNTAQLFEENYVELFKNENEVWLPKIKFKSSPFMFCPFLLSEFISKNKFKSFCELHSGYKPLICSMSPIGRLIVRVY